MAVIAVVGTGYVGLVSGACLASMGHDVICADKDRDKIRVLQSGGIPIYEPGLSDLVAAQVAAGRLRFDVDVGQSVKERDAVFLAVGTPSDGKGGRADLSFVFAAAKEVAENLDGFSVLVTKSTVPVGTNRAIEEIALRYCRPDAECVVASNPEFLREGQAIEDFMKPDRILVGTEDPRAVALLRDIYHPILAQGCRFLSMGLEAAELTKYAANAFLAVKLSFINEMADLCEAVGADVEAVASGIGSDRRIGSAFLRVGPGWGGSCFPKDTRALCATADDNGIELRVVRSSIEANERRKESLVERIEAAFGGDLTKRKVALLGLAFKGQTDDLRESPSLDIASMLLARGAEVTAYDPSVMLATSEPVAGLKVALSPLSAAEGAEALVIATDWQEFTSCKLTEIAAAMADPLMIDLRNLFSEAAARKSGFRAYISLGRPSEDSTRITRLSVDTDTLPVPGARRELKSAV